MYSWVQVWSFIASFIIYAHVDLLEGGKYSCFVCDSYWGSVWWEKDFTFFKPCLPLTLTFKQQNYKSSWIILMFRAEIFIENVLFTLVTSFTSPNIGTNPSTTAFICACTMADLPNAYVSNHVNFVLFLKIFSPFMWHCAFFVGAIIIC